VSLATNAERHRKVRFVLAAILVANWAVAAAKLLFGIFSGSAAVTADGLHSFIDGASNIIGLVAMSVAARPADESHPYGHEKFEALASLAIGAMVGMAMLALGRVALDSLLHDRHPQVTWTMAGVMVATLATNLVVTRVEKRWGERLKSQILLADARHTLSDVFVTLSVLASLWAVKLGYPKADGLVALFILAVVTYVAYAIIRQAIGALSDTARLDPRKVSELVASIPGVWSCRDVRSRGMEATVYVDLKIDVDPAMSTDSAHALSTQVEQKIAAAYPDVVDVVVHVEPAPP